MGRTWEGRPGIFWQQRLVLSAQPPIGSGPRCCSDGLWHTGGLRLGCAELSHEKRLRQSRPFPALQPRRQPPHWRAAVQVWQDMTFTPEKPHRCEALAAVRQCLGAQLSIWTITCRAWLAVLTQCKILAQRSQRNSGKKKGISALPQVSEASRVLSVWRQMGKIKPN